MVESADRNRTLLIALSCAGAELLVAAAILAMLAG
jgi:hypothetical protein